MMCKRKIKTILVSQPQPTDPEKSPFYELSKKFSLKIDYRKFFKIDRLSSREFREQKIYLNEYMAIIFTSRQAVDHYFSMTKDLRYSPPDTTKYFCMSETIALYLQKYIQFRKRKIFFCNNQPEELADLMKKHEKETFLLPCSDENNDNLTNYLTEKKFKIRKAVFFRPLKEELNDVNLSVYDMLIFFSPLGIKSLFENFPDYKQNDQIIAAYGELTSHAISDAGLQQQIIAPTEQFPSIIMALEDYLVKSNKKK
jgi:uroporphyrinogen-III synthase